MSDEHKQYASTAAATLEAHILSVHSAKSEAEWWAHREIERLRAENEKLRAENETHKEIAVRETMKVATLRAALKPFADLDRHWEGDKMPLQPKTIMLEPLPILYAIKALKETGDGTV